MLASVTVDAVDACGARKAFDFIGRFEGWKHLAHACAKAAAERNLRIIQVKTPEGTTLFKYSPSRSGRGYNMKAVRNDGSVRQTEFVWLDPEYHHLLRY